MKFLHGVYEYSFIRFLAVGLSNLVITYGIFLAVLSVAQYALAFAAAFLAGMIYTAVLNIHHTFARQASRQRVGIYACYYSCYALINLACIALLVEVFDVSEELAFLGTQVVLVPVHYCASRFLIRRIAPPRAV